MLLIQLQLIETTLPHRRHPSSVLLRLNVHPLPQISTHLPSARLLQFVNQSRHSRRERLRIAKRRRQHRAKASTRTALYQLAKHLVSVTRSVTVRAF